jgi:DNA-binding GntR family transcriptional regulator
MVDWHYLNADQGVLLTILDDTNARQTKSSRLMLQIRNGIMDGRHPLGSPLREEALEHVYGTSRGPVREALRVLELRGLVTHRERRGFRVRGYTRKSVGDLYRLRSVLERMSVEALVGLETGPLQALIQNLNASNRHMQAHLAEGCTGLYLQENVVFHQHIVRACNNEMLERSLMVLNETAEPLRHALLRKKGSLATAHLEHQKITDHIASRNFHAAAAVTESHVLENLPKVLEVLDDLITRRSSSEELDD